MTMSYDSSNTCLNSNFHALLAYAYVEDLGINVVAFVTSSCYSWWQGAGSADVVVAYVESPAGDPQTLSLVWKQDGDECRTTLEHDGPIGPSGSLVSTGCPLGSPPFLPALP